MIIVSLTLWNFEFLKPLSELFLLDSIKKNKSNCDLYPTKASQRMSEKQRSVSIWKPSIHKNGDDTQYQNNKQLKNYRNQISINHTYSERSM
jgi:hypothetical protein